MSLLRQFGKWQALFFPPPALTFLKKSLLIFLNCDILAMLDFGLYVVWRFYE
jgi:hypothetical protein